MRWRHLKRFLMLQSLILNKRPGFNEVFLKLETLVLETLQSK